MRLESIEAIAVRAPRLESVFVKIDSDTGFSGWGEVQAARLSGAVCEIVHTLLKPILDGAPFESTVQGIERLREAMSSAPTGALVADSIAGVELALWDLAGKANCMPVSRLIAGRRVRGRVPSYASGSGVPHKAATINLAGCGLTEGLRLARIAADRSSRIVIPVGASLGPQLAAAIQFAAALPEDSLVDVEYDPLVVDSAHRLTGILPPHDGKYPVSALPGLGIEIDEPELRLIEERSR